MKKIFFVIAAAAMMLVGCTKELEQKVNDLDNRVTALEEAVKDLNSKTASIQTILDALNAKVYVSSVTQTDNGYEILFTDGKKATISNGKDGQNGKDGEDGEDGVDGQTPVVGIAKDTDGVLYWTLNGEFILVDGAKVPATGANGEDGENGKDGLTPEFKLVDGHLYVTIGDKETDLGVITGSDGDAWFSKLEQKDGYVILTLADGTGTIGLPLYNDFKLTIANEEIKPLKFGEVAVLKYNVTGSSNFNVIAQASQGWTAVVNKSAQTIAITAPEEGNDPTKAAMDFSNGSVLVAASDNETDGYDLQVIEFKYSTDGARLKFNNATDSTEVAVPLSPYGSEKAGEMLVPVETNAAYEVEVPVEWMAYTGSKAMRTDRLAFVYEPNKTGDVRNATVIIKIGDKEFAKILFSQKPMPTALKLNPNEAELVIGSALEFTPVVTPAAAQVNLDTTFAPQGNPDTLALAKVGGKVVVNPAYTNIAEYKWMMSKNPWKVFVSDAASGLKDSINVTIKAVPVTEVKAEKEVVKLMIKQQQSFKISVLPENASDKELDIVVTDENGQVNDAIETPVYDPATGILTLTGKNNGYANITITAKDMFAADPTKLPYAEIEVIVTNDAAPTGVDLKLADGTVVTDGGSASFHFADTLKFAPVNADNALDTLKTGVTFEVLRDGKPSKNLVVDYNDTTSTVMVTKADGVENYMETLVGNYTLTAVHEDNAEIKSEFTLTVTCNKVTGLFIDVNENGTHEPTAADSAFYVSMTAPDTLKTVITPANADDKTVRFWSADESIAKVDENGIVTGYKSGKTYVFAEAMDKFNLSTNPADHPRDTVVVYVNSDAKIEIKNGTRHYKGFNILTGKWKLVVDSYPNDDDYEWIVRDDSLHMNTNQLILDNDTVKVNPEVFRTMQDHTMIGRQYTIFAVSTFDPTAMDSVKVTVGANIQSKLELHVDDYTMFVGDTYKPQYTLEGKDSRGNVVEPDCKDVRFRVSSYGRQDVIDVNETTGEIVAKRAGTATLILESMDKYNPDTNAVSHLIDSCFIYVKKNAPTAVKVSDINVKALESAKLSVVVTPEDTVKYDMSVTYELISGNVIPGFNGHTFNYLALDGNKVTAENYAVDENLGTWNADHTVWTPAKKTSVDSINTYFVRVASVLDPTVADTAKIVIKPLDAPLALTTVREATVKVGEKWEARATYTWESGAKQLLGEFDYDLDIQGNQNVAITTDNKIEGVAPTTTPVEVIMSAPEVYETDNGTQVPLFPYKKPVSTKVMVTVIQ